MQELKDYWGDLIVDRNSFIVDLKGGTIVQPLSFKPLADHLQRDTTSMKIAKSNQKAVSTEKSKTVSN
jgi:hypothetical protein